MRVMITGVTGTLGAALGCASLARGDTVLGVGRKATAPPSICSESIANAQCTSRDAADLLDRDPDLVLLCAGQIESEVGPGGLPLPHTTESIHRINSVFPSLLALEAAERRRARRLDVIAIGSIADGSPSAFGPVYHASKASLHHFVTGAGPIIHAMNPQVRLRLYRPGVIKGPLSWAPTVRLNERGRRIRARRCQGAPEADVVAASILAFAAGDDWVGGDREPLSFRLLKHFWALSPNLYYRLQIGTWRRVNKFGTGEGDPPEV